MIIDTHAHLDDKAFRGEVADVINRACDAGVGLIINPGYDMRSSRAAMANARANAQVYALVGIHPHDASKMREDDLQTLREYLKDERVLGVGEIGLDYYRDLSPRQDQIRAFRDQFMLAVEERAPVVIHNRDAHKDTLDIVKEFRTRAASIVLHCFSGTREMARELTSLGCYISIGGPVTYANARKAREVAAEIDLSRLLVETDCPYLPPTPYRGQRNEPAYVVEVVTEIARIRNMTPSQLAEVTTMNAMRAFGISLR